MATSICKFCGSEVTRRGKKLAVFCSLTCKGEWQKTQKPVTKEWLLQKYVEEGLGIYQIGKIVDRNPKQVWHWLKGYCIPLREREWEIQPDPTIPYQQPDWLREQYIDEKRSAPEIATQFAVTTANIIYFLRRFSIPLRNISEARKVKHWGAYGEKNPMYGKVGNLHPNWKGGISPERQAFYSSPEWSKAVKAIWQRDQGHCQRCRMKASAKVTFHIHHITSFAVRELRCELSNLLLVCESCHHWIHSKQNVNCDFLK
jgi:hypothetical protein